MPSFSALVVQLQEWGVSNGIHAQKAHEPMIHVCSKRRIQGQGTLANQLAERSSCLHFYTVQVRTKKKSHRGLPVDSSSGNDPAMSQQEPLDISMQLSGNIVCSIIHPNRSIWFWYILTHTKLLVIIYQMQSVSSAQAAEIPTGPLLHMYIHDLLGILIIHFCSYPRKQKSAFVDHRVNSHSKRCW